jgi:hypothetical protein
MNRRPPLRFSTVHGDPVVVPVLRSSSGAVLRRSRHRRRDDQRQLVLGDALRDEQRPASGCLGWKSKRWPALARGILGPRVGGRQGTDCGKPATRISECPDGRAAGRVARFAQRRVRSASRRKLHQEAGRESEKSLGEADESATGSTFFVLDSQWSLLDLQGEKR